MYEEQLKLLSPRVEFSKEIICVPSYLELYPFTFYFMLLLNNFSISKCTLIIVCVSCCFFSKYGRTAVLLALSNFSLKIGLFDPISGEIRIF